MNAPMGTPADERRSEISEAEGYIASVRHELDALWAAARDATAPNGEAVFPPESNRKAADDAAFEVLQCLHHIETHLLNLARLP